MLGYFRVGGGFYARGVEGLGGPGGPKMAFTNSAVFIVIRRLRAPAAAPTNRPSPRAALCAGCCGGRRALGSRAANAAAAGARSRISREAERERGASAWRRSAGGALLGPLVERAA